jgi:hypothetical protein
VIPGDIGAELARVLRTAVAAGELPGAAAGISPAGTWRAAPPGAGGGPGVYATSLPFALAQLTGRRATEHAERLALRLTGAPGIGAAAATGGGYLTVTVTDTALAGLAARVVAAGPACAASDALLGLRLSAPGLPELAAASTWEQAWRGTADAVTGRLAERAGAQVAFQVDSKRTSPATPAPPADRRTNGGSGAAGVLSCAAPAPDTGRAGVAGQLGAAGPAGRGLPAPDIGRAGAAGGRGTAAVEAGGCPADVPGTARFSVAGAVAFAGAYPVRYALARATASGAAALGRRFRVSNDLSDPCYAVCYAHADAASASRWAADLGVPRGEPDWPGPGLLAHPRERELLAVISWLPERVAGAARRRRPAEIPAYLEHLAAAWLDCRESCPALPFGGMAAPTDRAQTAARLGLADAARTALAAGLELLGIAAPRRI